MAEVGANATVEDKQTSQRLAYVASAIPRLLAPEPIDFELELDGRVMHVCGSSIVVTNVRGIGLRGLQWGEWVSIDDGVLDVIIVGADDAIEHLELLWDTITGQAVESDVIEHYQLRSSLCVRSRGTSPSWPMASLSRVASTRCTSILAPCTCACRGEPGRLVETRERRPMSSMP